MQIRTLSKTALQLGMSLAVLATATSAHADSSYQPYYYNNADTAAAITPYATTPQTTVPLSSTPSYQPSSDNVPGRVPSPIPTTQMPASDNVPGRNLGTQTQKNDCNCPAFPLVGTAAIHHSDNDIWFAFGGEYLNYKESIGPIPDSERGWMPSFAVGGDYLSRDKWYMSAQGSVAFGDAPYEGALQNNLGQETPYDDWTHETIADISGKIGHGFDIGSYSMVTPYVEMGLQYWDRDLRGIGGYVEDYYHFDALGGLMFQTSPIERLVLSTYGAYGPTFANKMKTQDVPDFHIGSTGMLKVGGKISYALTRRIDLFTTMDFEHFRNVQSELEPDLNYPVPNLPNYYYAVSEPSSYTNELTSRLGIAYHFD